MSRFEAIEAFKKETEGKAEVSTNTAKASAHNAKVYTEVIIYCDKIMSLEGTLKTEETVAAEQVKAIPQAEATGTAPKRRGRPKMSEAEKLNRPEKAVKIAAPQVEGAKRRGRPPLTEEQKLERDQNKKEGVKSIDLPSLLETIGQEQQKPLAQHEFVTLALEAGYLSKAQDFSNIVYQALVKLVKKGTFKKVVGEEKQPQYEYVKVAA